MIRFTIILSILFVSVIKLTAQLDDSDWTDRITLNNQGNINTENTEFSPVFWKEFIVYVGSKKRQKLFDKKTNEPYFDLFLTAPDNKGQLDRTASFSKVINSDYHEGPLTFTSGGDKIYFTRVDYEGNELKMNTDNVVLNKIYESNYSDEDWSTPIKSSINVEDYTSCHPALTRDGQMMIFSSDRPEGYGKMDLYISELINGEWSTPQNLGPEINTEENELFPNFIEPSFLLYSTDGLSNKNDLDIYKVRIDNLKKIPFPIKLPLPVNSEFDDFSLILDPVGLNGFLSSNRPGGVGRDDIYSVSSTESVLSYNDATYNKLSVGVQTPDNESASNTIIKVMPIGKEAFLSFDQSLFEINEETATSYTTNNLGKVIIDLSDGYNLIYVNSENYKIWKKVISSENKDDVLEIQLEELETIKTDTIIQYIDRPIKNTINNVEVKKGATLIFNNIYYDYNSDKIIAGAASELDQLAKLMTSNPNLKIQLSAHTDSRGEKDYNQLLSEKRALSAKNYLIKKGANPTAIQTKGFGETSPRNHCKDGINCSEAEHIYNRRTEVKVLKF